MNFLMKSNFLRLILLVAAVFALANCDKLGGSKLTAANYDKITTGMSKTQVEDILGHPTSMETKDMIIFKKTTWRYEEGKQFVMITFKNNEVDGKESNLEKGR